MTSTPERPTRDAALDLLTRWLEANDVETDLGAQSHELVATLPGERKLKTVVSLVVGDEDLSVSAFVIRHPDENDLEFYRFLLRRNLRLPGLAYAVDGSGDVYVVGRTPLEALTDERLDRLLGVVLQSADSVFNDLLVIGFRTSMQKEWDWRISRGESTRNLEAFRHLLEHPDDAETQS